MTVGNLGGVKIGLRMTIPVIAKGFKYVYG